MVTIKKWYEFLSHVAQTNIDDEQFARNQKEPHIAHEFAVEFVMKEGAPYKKRIIKTTMNGEEFENMFQFIVDHEELSGIKLVPMRLLKKD